MAKKILCVLIVAVLVLGILPTGRIDAYGVTQIRDHQSVMGRTYSVEYAQKLDDIFSGNAKLFSNTTATFALGTSLNNRKVYQIADVISGYQCYIYAQAVYYYLFGDIPYTGNGLVYWSNSSKVMENQSVASYDLFVEADIGFGAYIRTTTNRDGSFNGSGGHSMIVLGYDKEGITYLEGNADGYGLVCVTSRTWDEFNSNQLSGRSRKICHIVQCNDISYCPHEGYSSQGDCLGCQQPYHWEASFCGDAAGMYTVEEKILLYLDKPYANEDADAEAEAGEPVEVLGSCENAAGELWYQILLDGQIYYAPAQGLTYQGCAPLRVICDDFAPSQRAVLEKKSQPVMGTVKSNYPLTAIYAYLDGSLYATWYANDQATTQVSLRQTDVNHLLAFASLADGKHTVELEAYSFVHEEGTRFHKSVFYMCVQPVEETFTVSFDANGGQGGPESFIKYADEDAFLSQMVPTRAGYEFLGWASDPGAIQPEYQGGDRFAVNADTTLYALWKPQGMTLSGTVTSYLTDGEVTLSLMKEREVVATVTLHEMTAEYAMEGLSAGTYTLRIEKDNHAARTYSLTLSAEDLVQDVKICPVGDLTGDGVVNVKDYQRMLRHVNKTLPLEGYALVCADVTNDGNCSAKDYQRLLRHVNKSLPLF